MCCAKLWVLVQLLLASGHFSRWFQVFFRLFQRHAVIWLPVAAFPLNFSFHLLIFVELKKKIQYLLQAGYFIHKGVLQQPLLPYFPPPCRGEKLMR